eukprot:TRINITY_DN8797_c0_g1_i1.p1 TRINITY_DN8797_c0_g1~~TRINITY_DN8797_c0_g1_i1.p1  ORF type:complete len:1102 (-),score=114.83 TRINITY_DN8797_c0_g1_i1:499-3804(-)
MWRPIGGSGSTTPPQIPTSPLTSPPQTPEHIRTKVSVASSPAARTYTYAEPVHVLTREGHIERRTFETVPGDTPRRRYVLVHHGDVHDPLERAHLSAGIVKYVVPEDSFPTPEEATTLRARRARDDSLILDSFDMPLRCATTPSRIRSHSEGSTWHWSTISNSSGTLRVPQRLSSGHRGSNASQHGAETAETGDEGSTLHSGGEDEEARNSRSGSGSGTPNSETESHKLRLTVAKLRNELSDREDKAQWYRARKVGYSTAYHALRAEVSMRDAELADVYRRLARERSKVKALKQRLLQPVPAKPPSEFREAATDAVLDDQPIGNNLSPLTLQAKRKVSIQCDPSPCSSAQQTQLSPRSPTFGGDRGRKGIRSNTPGSEASLDTTELERENSRLARLLSTTHTKVARLDSVASLTEDPVTALSDDATANDALLRTDQDVADDDADSVLSLRIHELEDALLAEQVSSHKKTVELAALREELDLSRSQVDSQAVKLLELSDRLEEMQRSQLSALSASVGALGAGDSGRFSQSQSQSQSSPGGGLSPHSVPAPAPEFLSNLRRIGALHQLDFPVPLDHMQDSSADAAVFGCHLRGFEQPLLARVVLVSSVSGLRRAEHEARLLTDLVPLSDFIVPLYHHFASGIPEELSRTAGWTSATADSGCRVLLYPRYTCSLPQLVQRWRAQSGQYGMPERFVLWLLFQVLKALTVLRECAVFHRALREDAIVVTMAPFYEDSNSMVHEAAVERLVQLVVPQSTNFSFRVAGFSAATDNFYQVAVQPVPEDATPPLHVAPEVVRSATTASTVVVNCEKSDLFSLGVLAHSLCVALLPFKSPLELTPQLLDAIHLPSQQYSRRLESVIKGLMHPDPASRWSASTAMTAVALLLWAPPSVLACVRPPVPTTEQENSRRQWEEEMAKVRWWLANQRDGFGVDLDDADGEAPHVRCEWEDRHRIAFLATATPARLRHSLVTFNAPVAKDKGRATPLQLTVPPSPHRAARGTPPPPASVSRTVPPAGVLARGSQSHSRSNPLVASASGAARPATPRLGPGQGPPHASLLRQSGTTTARPAAGHTPRGPVPASQHTTHSAPQPPAGPGFTAAGNPSRF